MNSSIPNHAIARIFAQRVPVGAGFLVSPRYLLTCAHVVEAALGLPKYAPDAPTQRVEFDCCRNMRR
ncbi:peptidase S1 and S6, chymotrypsin/Hap [Candidatus Moduliflexus flocculans]|uniref:Peptidase S1 and S6, chymotrypsin/Hap n=1 Tax=Candidatus Moduliflexus flocculans TaxID=1499966 RepID=A0A0S6VVG1_9BACT|nr:peptidase S1 and S6, chymotrypsin/Hap [Candidatus Moduliflexus flocculans]